MSIPTTTALLVIDAQVGLLDRAYRRDEVVVSLAELIAKARTAGAPVIYVQHDSDEAGDLLEVGSPSWRIHPALTPRDTEPVVHKRSSDSFYRTTLQLELDARRVTRLIVGGMKTEMCVDTTSRAAVSRGYDVSRAADAHTTTDTGTLPAAQMIAYHNEILDDFGNDDHVVTTADARSITL